MRWPLLLAALVVVLVAAQCTNPTVANLAANENQQSLSQGDVYYHTAGMPYGAGTCIWRIHASPPWQSVALTGVWSLGVNYDRIIFYDGASSSAPVISIMTASDYNGYSVGSSQPYLTFQLVTDAFMPKQGGFEFQYNAVNMSWCSGTIVQNYTRDDDGTGNSQAHYSEPATYFDYAQYRRNSTCRFLIPRNPIHRSVRIDFLTVGLVPGDAYYLYDGPDESAPLVAAWGTQSVEYKLFFSASWGLLKFVSLDTDKLGFKGIEYDVKGFFAPPHCDPLFVKNLTLGVAQTFSEPPVGLFKGENFAPNTKCLWQFWAPEGDICSFRICENHLGPGNNSLIVYDGPTESSPVLFVLGPDGFPYADYLQGTQRSMLVKLVTGYGPATEGISFTMIARAPPVQCSGVQIFQNQDYSEFGAPYPNYPQTPYGPNMNCTWIITRPSYQDSTLLRIPRFAASPGDTLTISLLNGVTYTPVRTLRGGNASNDLSSMNFGNLRAMVTFVGGSNPLQLSGAYLAFDHFVWQAPCSGLVVLNGVGDVTSPNYAEQLYSTPADCSYLLQAYPGYYPYVYIFHWDLGPGASWLFYDGNNTAAPLIANFTGRDPSRCQEVFGSAPSMFVRFLAPGPARNSTHIGYQSQFRSIPQHTFQSCPDAGTTINLSYDNGYGTYYTVQSAGDPARQNHGRFLDCIWTFNRPTDYVNSGYRFFISYFDLSDGDSITIYDGSDMTTSPIIYLANTTFQTRNFQDDGPIITTSQISIVRYRTGTLGSGNFYLGVQAAPPFSFPYPTGRCVGQTQLNSTFAVYQTVSPLATTGMALSSGMRCSWLIDVNNDEDVIQVGQYYQYGSPDYAPAAWPGLFSWAVYDGPNSTSPKLLDASSYYYRQASGRYIYIEFNTSSAQQLPSYGMIVQFRTADPLSGPCSGLEEDYTCGSRYIQNVVNEDAWNGRLNFPQPQVCSWRLYGMPNTIWVVLDSVNSLAGNETVTIYDGLNITSPVLVVFREDYMPAVRTTQKDIFVVYDTHGVSYGTGFRFRLDSVFEPLPCEGFTEWNFYPTGGDNYFGTAQALPRPDARAYLNYDEYARLFPEAPNRNCTFRLNVPVGGKIILRLDMMIAAGGYLTVTTGQGMIYAGTGYESWIRDIYDVCGDVTVHLVTGPGVHPVQFFRLKINADINPYTPVPLRCLRPDDVPCYQDFSVHQQEGLASDVGACTVVTALTLNDRDTYISPVRHILKSLDVRNWDFSPQNDPASGPFGGIQFPQLQLVTNVYATQTRMAALNLTATFINSLTVTFARVGAIILPNVTQLNYVDIENVATLDRIEANNLRWMYNFKVISNDVLKTISFAKMNEIDVLNVIKNFNLLSISMPSLVNFYDMTIGNTLQTVFALPLVTEASWRRGGFTLCNMQNLALVNVTGSPGFRYLQLANTAQLFTFEASTLEYLIGNLYVSNAHVANFQLPALQMLGCMDFLNSAALGEIYAPNLQSATKIDLEDSVVSTLSFPSLQAIYGPFQMTRNYNLVALDMCNISVAQQVTIFQCAALSCPETQILFNNTNATVDAVAPNCNPTLFGSFGCREDMVRQVDTRGCGFSLACIQQQISASYYNKRTQVVLPAGTYTGCATPLSTAGKLITMRGATAGATTIIDCSGGSTGRSLVINQNEDARLVIQDITIRNNANGLLQIIDASPTFIRVTFQNGIATTGGAVLISGTNAAPQFVNVTFVANSAVSSGGALAVLGAAVVLDGCFFTSNGAGTQGGAVALRGTSQATSMSGVYFYGNTAPQGGAVFADSGLEIATSQFLRNSASQFGGAVAVVPATQEGGVWANISGSHFDTNSGRIGGALYGFSSNLYLAATQVTNNVATVDGGGIQLLCSPSYRILIALSGPCDIRVILDHVTLTGNAAGGNGGAVNVQDSQLWASGGAMGSNSAALSGGGVYAPSSFVEVVGATFSSNVAQQNGGAVYCAPFAGSCHITNSAISGNSAGVTGGGVYLCTTSCANTTATAATTLPALASGLGNSFSGNLVDPAGYGKDVSSDPATLAWVLAPLSIVVSGRPVSTTGSLAVGISDSFGSLVTASSTLLAVSLDITFINGTSAPAVGITGSAAALALQGVATFSGVTLQAPQESTGMGYLLRAKLSSAVKVASALDLAPCAPGQGRASTTGPMVCVDCLPGFAGSGAGDYLCVQCTPGTFAATTQSSTCAPCAANTHASLAGASQCEKCVDGYTAVEGSADCTATDAILGGAASGSIFGPVVGASVGVCFLIVIGGLVLWRLARRRTMQKYYLDSDATIRASGVEETPLMKAVKKIIGASSTTRCGGGQFADVYRAKHEGQWIALKVIKKEMLQNMEAQSEFRREAVSLSRLSELRHGGIVGLVFFLERNPMCVAMDFCSNGTLKRLLITQQLSTQDKVRFAAETAAAMVAVHSRQVVHLDLKTDNLLLDDDMHIKLADFGISRILGDVNGPPPPTATGTTPPLNTQSGSDPKLLHNPVFGSHGGSSMGSMGSMTFAGSSNAPIPSAHAAFTPQYVDPLRIIESTVQDDDFLRSSDVFSFAIVMWALYKQEEPYVGMQPEDLIRELKADPTKRPPVIEGIHPIYGRVMQQCWHPDPRQRPGFAAVAAQLSVCLWTFGAELHGSYAAEMFQGTDLSIFTGATPGQSSAAGTSIEAFNTVAPPPPSSGAGVGVGASGPGSNGPDHRPPPKTPRTTPAGSNPIPPSTDTLNSFMPPPPPAGPPPPPATTNSSALPPGGPPRPAPAAPAGGAAANLAQLDTRRTVFANTPGMSGSTAPTMLDSEDNRKTTYAQSPGLPVAAPARPPRAPRGGT